MPDNQSHSSTRPTLCRNCGALIGAGETGCQVCGASGAEPTPASVPLHERYAISYARAVLSRPYIFTIVFLVANLFVFMLMWQSSGTSGAALWTGFDEPVLLAYGAKTNYWIHHGHQYWRLVTPIFIHVNLPHVLINMYSLWIIGPWVEKLYGSAKFVVFWVATGVAGVLASYLTVIPGSHPGVLGSFLIKAGDAPSAGASGALFGLVGVLFVFGIKYRRELPEGFKRAFGTGMLPVILLNLGIGFMARGFIDNAAHLGGLAAGAVFASVISYKRPGTRTSVTIAWRVGQIAALLLVVVCFAMAARAFVSNPRPTDLSTEIKVVNENNEAFVAGEAAVIAALKNGDPGKIDSSTAQLGKARHYDGETDAVGAELKSLLGRASKYADSSHQPGWTATTAAVADRKKLVYDLEEWQKRYVSWFEAVCTKLGLACAKVDTPK